MSPQTTMSSSTNLNPTMAKCQYSSKHASSDDAGKKLIGKGCLDRGWRLLSLARTLARGPVSLKMVFGILISTHDSRAIYSPPAAAALHSFKVRVSGGKINVTADRSRRTPPGPSCQGEMAGGHGVVLIGGGSVRCRGANMKSWLMLAHCAAASMVNCILHINGSHWPALQVKVMQYCHLLGCWPTGWSRFLAEKSAVTDSMAFCGGYAL
jgi:hypothetical protein